MKWGEVFLIRLLRVFLFHSGINKYLIFVFYIVHNYILVLAIRLDALMFGLSLDVKTFNLKPGLRLLLLIWGGG